MKAALINQLPLPESTRTKYDFRNLQVGEVIIVPPSKRNSLQSCAWRASKKFARRYKVKLFVHKGKLRAGCWRLE
jgi:hypothetical protein